MSSGSNGRPQAQSTCYNNALVGQQRQNETSAGVNYGQSFHDCGLIRGRYTRGPGLRKADLRYERGAFSVGFLQTRSDDYRDNAVQFTYSLALDSGRQPAAKCEHVAGAPTPFRAIVDAATARPSFLPGEPLTRSLDTADASG